MTAQTCFEDKAKSAISWDHAGLLGAEGNKGLQTGDLDPQYKQARLALAQVLIAEGLEESLTFYAKRKLKESISSIRKSTHAAAEL